MSVCAVPMLIYCVRARDVMSDMLIVSRTDMRARLMLRSVACGFARRVVWLQAFVVSVRVSFVCFAARVRF